MNNIDKKMHYYNVLKNNTAWLDIIEEAIDIHEEKTKQNINPDFEWYEVHADPATLRNMVRQKIIDITLHTRKSTWYSVRDIDIIKEVINTIENKSVDSEQNDLTDNKITDIVDKMFSTIIGYDTFKQLIKKTIMSDKPVHLLFYGPPATAKTLFLEELSLLPDSRYILGSTMSKAGIVDYLMEYRPKYLIIDELEKAAGKDLSSLLSLMQTGIVSRMMKSMKEQIQLKTWVFAGANSINKLPKELLSRFIKLPFKEYSNNEYILITKEIMKREGINEELSDYISKKLSKYTNDVRDAVKVARLSKTKTEVDYIIRAIYG